MALTPHAEALDDFLFGPSRSPDEQDDEADEMSVPLSPHQGLAEAGVTSIAFHENDRKKDGKLIHEQPWHRGAAYMIAKGMKQTEVAKMMGKCKASVNLVCAQKWFRALVSYYIAQEGAEPLHALFAGAAEEAFWELKQMMQNDKTPAPVKEKICQSFIDRTIGKAPTTVQHVAKPSEDPRKDAANLYKELERLDAAKREVLKRQEEPNQVTKDDSTSNTTPTGPDFSSAN